VLLYYPYHSFDYVIDLLKTAALDPQVESIRICLYRVASQSRVVDALVNAVHNGKRVLAVVELAARFDEQANITWAQRLTEAASRSSSVFPGLKVHSKLLLIQRREEGQERFYTHIGTGNFNEKTARLYTDFSLLTYDQDLGQRCATCSTSCSTPTGATITSSCWCRRTAPARDCWRRSTARSPMRARGCARP
jgi:polyphosphate kinase